MDKDLPFAPPPSSPPIPSSQIPQAALVQYMTNRNETKPEVSISNSPFPFKSTTTVAQHNKVKLKRVKEQVNPGMILK